MEREDFDDWQNTIKWVERILQVFKCVWHVMSERRKWNEWERNEIKHKMHLFSSYRRISSFPTAVWQELVLCFSCLPAKDKPAAKLILGSSPWRSLEQVGIFLLMLSMKNICCVFDAVLCRTCLGGDGLAWLGCGSAKARAEPSASSTGAMRAGRAVCSLRFIFFPVFGCC